MLWWKKKRLITATKCGAGIMLTHMGTAYFEADFQILADYKNIDLVVETGT